MRRDITHIDDAALTGLQRVHLADAPAVERGVAESSATRVIHVAGQAGVRYSLTTPGASVG